MCVSLSLYVTLPSFLKRLTYSSWKGRYTKRRRDREEDLPSAGLLSKWLPQPELNPSKARSQELLPGLPYECIVPRLWAFFYYFPRPQAGSWMGSGAAGT